MIDKNSENDAKYMRLALKEAEKGISLTSPNPTVGCVIVKKERLLVGDITENQEVRMLKSKPSKALKEKL